MLDILQFMMVHSHTYLLKLACLLHQANNGDYILSPDAPPTCSRHTATHVGNGCRCQARADRASHMFTRDCLSPLGSRTDSYQVQTSTREVNYASTTSNNYDQSNIIRSEFKGSPVRLPTNNELQNVFSVDIIANTKTMVQHCSRSFARFPTSQRHIWLRFVPWHCRPIAAFAITFHQSCRTISSRTD